MVNRKECYKVLSAPTTLSKTVSIRVPKDFPLDGQELKLFIEEYKNPDQSKDFIKIDKSLVSYLKRQRKKLEAK